MNKQQFELTAESIANSAWNAVLVRATKKETDVIPEGFKTRQQLEKIWKLQKSEARDRVARLKKLGFIEEKSFRIPNANGVLKPVPHYRLK